MPRFSTAVAAFGLAATVLAQSGSVTSSAAASVISVFLLDSDAQSLDASLIGSKNGIQTLAVQCAPGTSDDQCGYPSAVTITAGPSTVHASAAYQGLTAEYGCDITGSTTGTCSITYIGQASDLATDESASVTATGLTTITTTGTLTAGDITFFPITVTAGAAAASGSGSASSSASSHSSSVAHSSSASSASRSASSSGGSVVSAASSAASAAASSSTARAGAAQIVAPGFIAAGFLGLAAFL